MLKIFIYDLFQSRSKILVFFKILSYLLLCFLFVWLIYLIRYYVVKNISFEKYNILFYILSYILSGFINYNAHRILLDPAIHKNNWYRFVFMISNFVFSLPSCLYIAFIIVFRENYFISSVNYCVLMFSVIANQCFDKHIIIKLLFLIINIFIIFFNKIGFALAALFFFNLCYHLLKKRCFDEFEYSFIRSNIIEGTYEKNITIVSMITEWLFIIREKKRLLFVSIFCSLGVIMFFEYLHIYNPSIFEDLTNLRLLLLASFISGSFSSVFGPYMMNWFYYYSEDFMSKNWELRYILIGKINLIKLITSILFIFTLPFIVIFNISLGMIFYFFVMNCSLSILISLAVGILEISRIDTTKSPRLRVEKGSLIATYIPWFCELIPVIIFKILYKSIPLFGIVIISIISFCIINLISEDIINKFTVLLRKKIDVKCYTRK